MTCLVSLKFLKCSLNALPPSSLYSLWKRSWGQIGSAWMLMRLVRLQGDIVDLLPPGGETSVHKKLPREAKLRSSMSISWKGDFSQHLKASLENHSGKIKAALNRLMFHQCPSIRWVSCSLAGFHFFLSRRQSSAVLDVRRRLKVREKKKGRTCSPPPSAQIRDTLEVTETERSNSLSPTSKAAASGVKTRTSVKDSEPPESAATSSTLPLHPREAVRGRRALRGQPTKHNMCLVIITQRSASRT